MPEDQYEIAQLIVKHLKNELSAEEESRLQNWLKENHQEGLLNEYNDSKWLAKQLLAAHETDIESARQEAYRRAGITPELNEQPKIFNINWQRFVAAASVFLMLSLGAYFWRTHNRKENIAQTEQKQQLPVTDVSPGSYKAKLTLSDGSTIVLDSAATGKLTQQGNVGVMNKEGGLVYEGATHNEKEVLYNTLSTAKGEIYSLQLSDGTKLWLNSGSSIRYPVIFHGKTRTVEMTGEVYFEVAKNEKMPFEVMTGGQKVSVLGTHFNINAYTDETKVRTTLLEGRVAVTPPGSAIPVQLKPGEQAVVSGSAIEVLHEVDTEQAVAWKNGYFQFSGEDLQTVMRQLERWYDVEIVYEGDIPERHFGGKLSRNARASEVLRVLEQNEIHFRIEGKRIIVTP